MKKPTLISLTSLLFAVAVAACAGAPAKAPETPKTEETSAELTLLGIGAGESTNQITPAPQAASSTSSASSAAATSAKDDGSDIVPPFTAGKPAPAKSTSTKTSKAPAKSGRKKAARANNHGRTAAR
jgi:hypothetical protein